MTQNKLRIVLLSGSNPYHNAGIVAYDIYKSLKKQGHTVILLTRNYDERFESGIQSIYGKTESRFRNLLQKVAFRLGAKRRMDPAYYMHSLNEKQKYIPTKKLLKKISLNPDLFVYLFPHGFLNARNLYELNVQTGTPVCVMPMDMAQFTGGCHYANSCEGFMHQCGSCPGLYSKKADDLTYKNLIYKAKFTSQTDLYTISNTWTSDLIKKSTVYSGKPNYHINIVIDETIYCPGEKMEARNLFSIPAGKKIIFFGATSVHEKRKGIIYLVEAINMLYNELDSSERSHIGIAIAGKISEEVKDLFPFDVYTLGHLTHDLLPKAFQMADVFVSPSIQDAGPMMVIQSMMCGTPVIAFEMGNAIDYIFDNITGYRIPIYNTQKLKEGIHKLLSKTDFEKKEMSVQCRQLALNKSSYNAFAQDFISDFNSFIHLRKG